MVITNNTTVIRITRSTDITPITAWTAYDLIDGTLELGAGKYLAYHRREQKYIAVVVFTEPLTDSWLALFKDAVKSQKNTWKTGSWGVTETCRYGSFKKEDEALDWLKSCIK